MKRHPQLQDLSREHYTALKLARDARAAANGDAASMAGMARLVVDFFARELEPHFQLEEKSLLPLLKSHGETVLLQRTEADHQELRALADALQKPDAATLLRFAGLLADHVRFEEREMFETVQGFADFSAETLPAGQ